VTTQTFGYHGEGARAASGATVERIRKLADELGYRPNPHATSLRTRRSNLVGVLVPRLSDIVLAGFVEAYAEAGVSIPVSRIVHTPFDARGGRMGPRSCWPRNRRRRRSSR
jgi:LacI family transcriptional regulator